MKKSTVKKLLVAMLSFAMIFAMAACGGGSSSGDEGSSEGAAGALKIFNSKMEIQDVFEGELADASGPGPLPGRRGIPTPAGRGNPHRRWRRRRAP